MGLLRNVSAGLSALAGFSTPTVDPTTSTVTPSTGAGDAAMAQVVDTWRAMRVARDVALQIPAMKKADSVIVGTVGTLPLSAWEDGTALDPLDSRVAWLLAGPQRGRTRQWWLSKVASDLLWHDRCVTRVTDRFVVGGKPAELTRIHPSRVTAIEAPNDPDTIVEWRIDGAKVKDPASELVIFDGGGIGGLDKLGGPLLTLYAELQAAAGRYAMAPHPHTILKNHGEDLDDDEIDALLTRWEQQRAARSTAYMNDVLEYIPTGYSAKDLQLTEAREHAAQEVARLTGLPPHAVGASSGSSLTYANVVEQRRDVTDALRPYLECIGQTLSLVDRAGRSSGQVLARQLTIRVDTTEYLRDPASTRMATWQAGITAGVLSVEDAKAQEPLALGLPTTTPGK